MGTPVGRACWDPTARGYLRLGTQWVCKTCLWDVCSLVCPLILQMEKLRPGGTGPVLGRLVALPGLLTEVASLCEA